MVQRYTVLVTSGLVLLGSLFFTWWKNSSVDLWSILDGDIGEIGSDDVKAAFLQFKDDIALGISAIAEMLVTSATIIAVQIRNIWVPKPYTGFSLGASVLDPLDPPMKTADPLGPYSVGVRRQSYTFDDRELNTSWWYPATTDPDCSLFVASGGIYGTACSNAPLDVSGGLYPLILYSPGLASHNDAYFFYLQNLASHGYIVVSISHLDATQAAMGGNPIGYITAILYMLLDNSSRAVRLLYSNWFRSTHLALTYRPQEVQFILDQAIVAAEDSSSFFNGVIDTDNIGMSGHSLGGFYSLIKGGGMAIHCDEPLSASESNQNNLLMSSVSLCAWPEAQNLTDPQALHDPRIKAIICLAPPLFFQTGAQIARAAAAIRTPVMFITGNDRRLETTLLPQQQAYTAATTPKYIVEMANTSHLLVSEAYHFNPGPGALGNARSKANFEEKANVYEVYSSAFFDVYLKDKIERKEDLHRKSSEFVARLEYAD